MNGADDAPPFSYLQGLVSSNALLQAAKILELVVELQRELTAIRGRPDTAVEEMTRPADANALLHAIKQHTEYR